MMAIENDIDIFFKETVDSVNYIMEDGSDEHLDMILSVTMPLDKLSAHFEILNEKLFKAIGSCTEEDLNVIMPKLLDLNKTCMTLLGAIRTSFIYRDVRVSLKPFSKCHDFLREMIYDVKHFRLNKDDGFKDLLSALNDL